MVRSGATPPVLPKQLPVTFEGEHVADAHFDGTSYRFELFKGNLNDGLTNGTLGLVLKADERMCAAEVRIIDRRF
jgi:hypothetical protein